MAKIVANYTNFVAASSTVTLSAGSGKVHAITVFGIYAAPSLVTFYDNTSASGNILFACYVSCYYPCIIIYPPHLALKFTVGLTVVTADGAICHVVTEESE
jgi:hypothetical protein